MKKFKCLSVLVVAALALSATSCQNDSWDFPDYDYTTVYFSYQYPVRTIVLGEDTEYDLSLDNEHKCKIMATMGGVYKNTLDRTLHVSLDDDLCKDIAFADETGSQGSTLKVMPSNYYSLPSDMTIVIPKGQIAGGMTVQLNDAFFNDPDAIKNMYVIPLRINSVEKADSVLSGKSIQADPNIHKPNEWISVPKNYILYCVKYVNPWHATYLRRGKDVGVGKNGDTSLDVEYKRDAAYIEKNELCHLKTLSMNEVEVSLKTKQSDNKDLPFTLILTFDDNGNCTVKEPSGASYTVTGSGKFVKKGDKNSWGGEDRDAIFLDYKIDFANVEYTITDIMTVRDRGIIKEEFSPYVIE